MKYRIKIQIDWYTSEAVYTPQYKSFIFWSNFIEYNCGGDYEVYFLDLNLAKEFINKIKCEKRWSTSYIYFWDNIK